jgi:hypothetical protein
MIEPSVILTRYRARRQLFSRDSDIASPELSERHVLRPRHIARRVRTLVPAVHIARALRVSHTVTARYILSAPHRPLSYS